MNTNANNSDLAFFDCFDDAWEFGTEEGGGDETREWERMNAYYTHWCM